MVTPITDQRVFDDCYDRQERERELVGRMWAEMPNDQKAIMRKAEAAEYLGVTLNTMSNWEEREILVPIIAPNRYRYYFIGHLWVFKILWLDEHGS